MVAGATSHMKWQATQAEVRPDCQLVHCLPVQLGSSMRGDTDRRGLVNLGADHAHQLLGAPCSHTSREDIH